MSAAAGWYADPEHPDFSRWWDGEKWTNHRQSIDADTGPIDAHVSVMTTTMHDLRRRLPAHSLLAKLAELDTQGRFTVPHGRHSFVHDDALPWYQGMLGEREVARLLAGLDPEWTVLHSVPIGRGDSDVDHVVIGPPGVVVINTKRHPAKDVWVGGRTMMIAGQKVHYLSNSAHEARRVAALLSRACGFSIEVRAVIALVDVTRLTERQSPDFPDVSVSVVRSTRLVGHLTGLRREYSPEQVQTIADAAVLTDTWRASARREEGVEEFVARLESPPRKAAAVVERAVYARRRARLVHACVVLGVAVLGVVALLNMPHLVTFALGLLGR